ncbi:putative LRR receptor-like serine/threonine-protein kinase [Senna tora]|uniref:non-specific serine/threonine protein kinase n=1 Tax=Senna tora TaxID=362788 RepID=A0A835CGP4_9FABA|nr:putative LRR receptor-like serine/threonine-protein kinase [Senna tora]
MSMSFVPPVGFHKCWSLVWRISKPILRPISLMIRDPLQGFDHLMHSSFDAAITGLAGSSATPSSRISSSISSMMSRFRFSHEEEALRSFDTECIAICNLRHRNLVKIISSCSNVDFKSLIMEFMPNGSLERWLYSHNYCLDILQRLDIMIDIASTLEYLHYGSSTPVVHCDVKPSNVLLDEDMVAHLSDFGVSKLLGEEKLQIYTKTVATVRYMAPEYGSEGVVSMKGDVYSYGIMLMEVFTRKKPIDDIVEGLSLKDWFLEEDPKQERAEEEDPIPVVTRKVTYGERRKEEEREREREVKPSQKNRTWKPLMIMKVGAAMVVVEELNMRW